MTARAGYRCGFFVALRDPLAKMTHAPPFSCFSPVIALLFAVPASKKARKYGAICAPACILPCSLQGAAGATLELMERRALSPIYEARSAALSAARRAGS
jgi:hypothetical protein